MSEDSYSRLLVVNSDLVACPSPGNVSVSILQVHCIIFCCFQIPTVYELAPHEKAFALKVEELLSNITQPEYRQVIIEVCNL